MGYLVRLAHDEGGRCGGRYLVVVRWWCRNSFFIIIGVEWLIVFGAGICSFINLSRYCSSSSCKAPQFGYVIPSPEWQRVDAGGARSNRGGVGRRGGLRKERDLMMMMANNQGESGIWRIETTTRRLLKRKHR